MQTELDQNPAAELSPEKIREQLELLVRDQVFRSSKRSISFLRYVVEETLNGSSEQIKERTIGVEVFGRPPNYDTNMDHVVRTAATELRKRLAIYYGDEQHRSELRMSLVPGSYIPHFSLPALPAPIDSEVDADLIPLRPAEGSLLVHHESVPPPVTDTSYRRWFLMAIPLLVFLIVGATAYSHYHSSSVSDIFWRPILDDPGPVLVAVGEVPNGPPTPSPTKDDREASLPNFSAPSAPTVPFADMVTIAGVVEILRSSGKTVLIRRESTSSFSDLREGPAVLVGAFNNEWSLRLTSQLRYSLALDTERHLIYIKDSKKPDDRSWSWATDQPKVHKHGGPALHDFALVSRIWNSDTGHFVIVIGGLYTYGTQSAGEFLTDPVLVQAVIKGLPLDNTHKNLQIVLGTTVTDDTPGSPRVLAVSAE